ncbi:MAG: hypothetical protein WHT06_12255 [Desulfobacterales bacterium]
MIHYRITVTPLGPRETELVSGTIWGHLAWAVRYLEGETAFSAWLEEQEHEPWLVSSYMPEGMLPKPILSPPLQAQEAPDFDSAERQKAFRKIKFIAEKTFLKLRSQMEANALVREMPYPPATHRTGGRESRTAHNRINRITGRTPDEGGLFFHDRILDPKERRFQVFIQTPTPCKEKIKALLDFIGSQGFGANASTGSGHMQFDVVEETELFCATGNRALTLSHGILTPNMTAPRYRLHTHHGKLGGHFAVGGFSPFKYPILMVKPGSTFTPEGEGLFGQLLTGVHHDPALAGVRHHALHLPLFFTEATA